MVIGMLDIDELSQSILFIVLEKDNVERMKMADPVTLESIRKGGMLAPIMYPRNFSILVAIEEDSDEVYRRARGNRMEFLEWLERGRVFIEGVDGKVHGFRIPGPGKKP
jgi:hypothetical protein